MPTTPIPTPAASWTSSWGPVTCYSWTSYSWTSSSWTADNSFAVRAGRCGVFVCGVLMRTRAGTRIFPLLRTRAARLLPAGGGGGKLCIIFHASGWAGNCLFRIKNRYLYSDSPRQIVNTEYHLAKNSSASKSSIRRFVITEKATQRSKGTGGLVNIVSYSLPSLMIIVSVSQFYVERPLAQRLFIIVA